MKTCRESGRATLLHLKLVLDLSSAQIEQILKLPEGSVRQWEQGSQDIPPGWMACVKSLNADLKRLLTILQPERIAMAIRRRNELFAGETALDWILCGRIGEVVERYELALSCR